MRRFIKNHKASLSVGLVLSATSLMALASQIPGMAPSEAVSAVASPGPVKTYQILRVKQVVSNSEQCGKLYDALSSMTDKPLSLQFSTHPTKSNYLAVNDGGAELMSHEFTVVDQKVSADGSQIHRVGMGSFTLTQGQTTYPVDYVINIDADTKQANFDYRYPMLLSGVGGHCEYVAVIQPDKETVESFKQHIKTGHVAKKMDLTATS